MGTGSEFVPKELAFHFAQSVKRNREQLFLFIVGYLKLLSITSTIQIRQNIYPSTIKLSTRLARYMFNLCRACPLKFRLVSLFLLINCVPNTDKKTMGQGARMTKCGQRWANKYLIGEYDDLLGTLLLV